MISIRGRYLIPALLAGAASLVAANAWFAFNSIRVLEQSQFWVQHTYQVMMQVETIMSSAKDAETGERGYLITGQEELLAPYRQAVTVLPRELDDFEVLTGDNPVQQAKIAEMRSRMIARLALLQTAIDIRRGGSSQSSAAYSVTGSGKVEMDALRTLANDMEAEERLLLATRLRDVESSHLRARITVGLASGLDFILLMFMFRYFMRERGLRMSAELTAQQLTEANARVRANSDEIQELNATLELRIKQRTAELETINRELEAFSYSVSHDLRAPLRTVDGFSLALEEDYADAVDVQGKDYIRRVRAGVQRMGDLIDALLQLSRITRAELERTDFDLSELVESVAAVLKQENPGRDIEFRIQPGMNMNGDRKLISVALENMLGNSVKFTSKLPSALIEFGWDEKKQAWFVRDNGAGFDMEYAGRLFNAFHRLHGDKDFKGSGIGLATVARVIRRHHGRIWGQSAVNQGATFWFAF